MEKKNLYYINGCGEYRLLAENLTQAEADKFRHKFLKDHNYNSPYTRISHTPEGLWYDFGSWSEFFLWGEHND